MNTTRNLISLAESVACVRDSAVDVGNRLIDEANQQSNKVHFAYSEAEINVGGRNALVCRSSADRKLPYFYEKLTNCSDFCKIRTSADLLWQNRIVGKILLSAVFDERNEGARPLFHRSDS